MFFESKMQTNSEKKSKIPNMTSRSTKLKARIGNQSEKMSRPKPDPMHLYDNSPQSSGYGPSVEQFNRDARIGFSRSASERTRSQDDHNHSRKTTVLSRVKEKAKRWKSSFLKKRNNHVGDSNSISNIHSWCLEDDDDDNDEEDDYRDENPEYLGAPMYESELAPEAYKEHARQHPRAFPVISEKHVMPSNTGRARESVETKYQTTASETEKHATHETHKIIKTDYDDVDDYYHETEKHLISENETPSSSRENKWDKGVSVKEYIMNKLEPGEDERVLSKVISDAMVAPMKNHGDRVGVMEKMKVAVNSLLGREQTNQSTMTQLNISISTEVQSVTEEENHGRILQTN